MGRGERKTKREREREERKRERRALLFSASYITLFIMPSRFYGEILRWKKRKTSRRAGEEGKGRRRKKLHCPGFISSHYDPRALSPPSPPAATSRRRTRAYPPHAPTHPSCRPLLTHPSSYHLIPLRPSSFPPPTTSSLTLNFLSCITGCFVFRPGI